MKKRIVYIALVIAMLSLITGGTLAYFTAEETVRNEITAGGVAVTLEEFAVVDGNVRPSPNQPIQVMPGDRVSKIVTARSNRQAAWVRMAYTVTVNDAQGEPMAVTPEELGRVITLTGRSDAWHYADGWWYYENPVETGTSTEPLFETVEFSATEMGNEYQGSTALIQVTVQAVQKANNGETVMEAAGWPAN